MLCAAKRMAYQSLCRNPPFLIVYQARYNLAQPYIRLLVNVVPWNTRQQACSIAGVAGHEKA